MSENRNVRFMKLTATGTKLEGALPDGRRVSMHVEFDPGTDPDRGAALYVHVPGNENYLRLMTTAHEAQMIIELWAP